MNRRQFLFTAVAGALATQSAGRADPTTRPASEFLTDYPPYDGNVLLARPTDRSINASVMLARSTKAQIHYGPASAPRTFKSAVIDFVAGEPSHVLLDGLKPNAEYVYELLEAADSRPLLATGAVRKFRTSRPAGSSFTFTIQADSHLDNGCRSEIYRQTLTNQLVDKPDFLIDMGDTSMAGKHPTRESALKQFLAQRYYFGLIGDQVPSFLLVGNHDGEDVKRPGADNADGLAVWANRQRKRFFANPEPDHFYSGNSTPHAHAGLLQNLYSWAWGDALFVVLDPYWTSISSRGNAAGWNMSIGKAQYDWLAKTLRASTATHKLVFIHQLIGGLDNSGRGGAEAAPLYEWGGNDPSGTTRFAELRPDWEMPIHDLLESAGVRMVFHGHDHFYAKQEHEGILYQLVPQCANRNFRKDHAAEYGYKAGDFLPSSGHLRVHVTPSDIQVDYVRAATPAEGGRVQNGDVSATYRLKTT